MTQAEIAAKMQACSSRIDAAVQTLAAEGAGEAKAEHVYRKALAEAWVKVLIELPKGTVPQREAWVNGVCADLRLDRDLARAIHGSAKAALFARQAQLSALQSEMALLKAEMEALRYSPQETP